MEFSNVKPISLFLFFHCNCWCQDCLISSFALPQRPSLIARIKEIAHTPNHPSLAHWINVEGSCILTCIISVLYEKSKSILPTTNEIRIGIENVIRKGISLKLETHSNKGNGWIWDMDISRPFSPYSHDQFGLLVVKQQTCDLGTEMGQNQPILQKITLSTCSIIQSTFKFINHNS